MTLERHRALAATLGAATFLTLSTSIAANDMLLKTSAADSLRGRNYLTPAADASLVAAGDVLLTGDFDGDGASETARRAKDSDTWRFSDGGTLSDGLGFIFLMEPQVSLVGDFDGNGRDDLAWRLDGCPFWIVNHTEGAPFTVLFDGISGIFVDDPDQVNHVGDFDGDGADEIAWRQPWFPGWAINDEETPLLVILDHLTDVFDPPVQVSFACDVTGDGSDELAWRKKGESSWRISSLQDPLALFADPVAGFDPSSADQVALAGDFDGNGTCDLAWRRAGTGSWSVSSSTGPRSFGDGFTYFSPAIQRTLVGDFDGDGLDDLAYRQGAGHSSWTVNSEDDSLWSLYDGIESHDPSLPHHVGDFDGDGDDDIAWLPAELLEWQVDSHNPSPGVGAPSWQESTEPGTIRYELAYTDADFDGVYDDYVLLVYGPEGDIFVLSQPIAMAYFLRVQGIHVTESFFDALNDEQRDALYADYSTAPGATDGITQNPPGGGGPEYTFNEFTFNEDVGSFAEMGAEIQYVGAESTNIQLGTILDSETTASVRIVHFEAMACGPHCASATFTLAQGQIVNGPFTGTLTLGQATTNAYITKGGFGLSAGATLIAVDGAIGDTEGTHFKAGVGFGVGGGVTGKWGENDQYGFTMDVKFVTVGAYVSGEDAESAFLNSQSWFVGAYDDSAGWTTQAWADTGSWFEGIYDSTEDVTVQFYNGIDDYYVDLSNDIADTFTDTHLQFQGFGEVVEGEFEANDTANEIVDDITQGGGQAANDVGTTLQNGGESAVHFVTGLFG